MSSSLVCLLLPLSRPVVRLFARSSLLYSFPPASFHLGHVLVPRRLRPALHLSSISPPRSGDSRLLQPASPSHLLRLFVYLLSPATHDLTTSSACYCYPTVKYSSPRLTLQLHSLRHLSTTSLFGRILTRRHLSHSYVPSMLFGSSTLSTRTSVSPRVHPSPLLRPVVTLPAFPPLFPSRP